ncbi:CopG/DNA-binding domain-containing protein [Kalymmatonema gypsitolerans NIES-4073]|nr:CopG/DNA-binding domain-containing protein [Scytonema sp. NIES-4073]
MSTRKGKKAVKNVPLFHDEVKTRHHILLTPTAWQRLQQRAKEQGISVSELIECWAMD